MKQYVLTFADPDLELLDDKIQDYLRLSNEEVLSISHSSCWNPKEEAIFYSVTILFREKPTTEA